MSSLRVGAGLSTDPDPERAVRAACADALRGLAGESCDLALLFVSPHHLPSVMEMVATVHELVRPGALLGCTGVAVVGGAREVEEEPAASVWAARLPDTRVETFALDHRLTADGESFLGWPDAVASEAAAVVLADPFTFPADEWLPRVNDEHPGLTVIGGMASGGHAPGEHRLVVDREVRNGGAVGALVAGRVRVRALVSQGCKPIGRSYTVTGAERNVLLELGGRSPVERLQETFLQAGEADRAAMQRGLHVGRVVDEYKTEFRRGDFLVRNVIGADEESGAVAVGDHVSVGEVVQFHVRDASSADEDLRGMIATVERPAGALLFTCNGRGSHLFGVPDHDARIVTETLAVPLAGFFCAGELGPVGGRNFLHGFTASLALFYES